MGLFPMNVGGGGTSNANITSGQNTQVPTIGTGTVSIPTTSNKLILIHSTTGTIRNLNDMEVVQTILRSSNNMYIARTTGSNPSYYSDNASGYCSYAIIGDWTE